MQCRSRYLNCPPSIFPCPFKQNYIDTDYHIKQKVFAILQSIFILLLTTMEENTGVSLPKSLEEARIKCIPSAMYYIPNFISEAEEKLIHGKVRNCFMNDKYLNLTPELIKPRETRSTPLPSLNGRISLIVDSSLGLPS